MKAPYYVTQMAYSEHSGPGKEAKRVAENDLMYQITACSSASVTDFRRRNADGIESESFPIDLSKPPMQHLGVA